MTDEEIVKLAGGPRYLIDDVQCVTLTRDGLLEFARLIEQRTIEQHAGLPDDLAEQVEKYATAAVENPNVPLPIGFTLKRILAWHESRSTK